MMTTFRLSIIGYKRGSSIKGFLKLNKGKQRK